ncbi:MAG: hypothetical protein HYV28_12405, partial [Ignavibacteriales bacterium]|nr:hypothetical protein [Ignavibacteriales bacterium]
KEYFYKLFYKSIEWFDTGKPKTIVKPGFESLAQELNLIDTKKLGSWVVTGTSPVDDYAYCMQFVNSSGTAAASELQVFEVENMVMDFLISYK